MLASLTLVFMTLRLGLASRRRRQRRAPRDASLIARHVRLARPAVVLVVAGFAGGPVSAVLLRDWTPFGSFHAFLGLLALALFLAAARIGQRLAARRPGDVNAHGWLGLLASLCAAVAAVAGFVLLP